MIQWVMKMQGISFRHAVELLHNDALPSLAADPSLSKKPTPVKHSTKRKRDVLPIDQENQTLLNQIIDFYHEALLQNPEALAYLQKRGLGNPKLIARFKLSTSIGAHP